MKKPKGVGVVATDQAPKAIGPYSQAVEVNGVIYTAGQVALDAARERAPRSRPSRS